MILIDAIVEFMVLLVIYLNVSFFLGQLVSGIRQEVEVTFHTSSIPILANNILRVTTSDGLSVSNGKDEETNIPLPATPANDLFTFKLFLQHVFTKDQVEGTVSLSISFIYQGINFKHSLNKFFEPNA